MSDKLSTLQASIGWIAIVTMFSLAWYLFDRASDKKSFRENYIIQQHCKKVGYAGKMAEPIYQCDTGLYSSGELWEMG